MEPGTGLAILGSALGGAKVLEKMLGPTADYLGTGIRDWTQRRVENVGRIFAKAHEKLGDKVDTPGGIPPRVLKEVMTEGSFCDDELTAEYFGGVLASSRSEVSRDDRAATYLRLTSELSSYQIRFHFICYYWWRKLYCGSGLRPTFSEDLHKMWLFLPGRFLSVAMEFSDKEPAADILLHCQSGLAREELIEINAWGGPEHMNGICERQGWAPVSEWGMSVCPTQYGIDYWLWSVGAGKVSRSSFLEATLSLPKLPQLTFVGSPQKLAKEDQKPDKAPEPTPTAVTPPAAPEPRQP